MRRLWKLIKWSCAAIVLVVVLLLLPAAYVEAFCRADEDQAAFSPQITETRHQRPEANSYLTYPEWHIVFAYEGLANVLDSGDEHRFGYLSSIAGFWSSFCRLNQASMRHGEASFVQRGVIHVIGFSFTLEMGAKALYEETLGRLFAMLRGPVKSPQDRFAAAMADDYAGFLQQTPWYEYDFDNATTKLWELPADSLRGWERRLALGGEWKAKSAYASAIGTASDAAGPVVLNIRAIVEGMLPWELAQLENVEVFDTTTTHVVIDAIRYRKFTRTLAAIARAGGRVVEIAGNDDIMLSALLKEGESVTSLPYGALIATVDRDGFGGKRILVDLPVRNLSDMIRWMDDNGITLEHVYDY